MTTSQKRGGRAEPLYRQLPHGPSRLSREAISRNQCLRLQGAMIESVWRHGYDATTVADLVAYAGVSRRALYEHYHDKHACLKATHDAVVRQACASVIKAWVTHRGWSNQLHGACSVLFEQATIHPAPARLVLVESPTITPEALARLQFASIAFERVLRASAQSGGARPDLPRLSARAIVGGIRQLLWAGVRDRRLDQLPALADEVLDWVELYRVPVAPKTAGRDRLTSASPVPRGTVPSLAPDPCEDRILGALAGLLDETEYASITDGQLARRARLPTQALHRYFTCKEHCASVLVGSIHAAALRAAALAAGELDWPERVEAGLYGYLAWLGTYPTLASVLFLAAFDLGADAAADLTSPISALLDLLLAGAPEPRKARRVTRRAIVGALWSTILIRISAKETRRLSELADRLGQLVLTPYMAPGELPDRVSHVPATPARPVSGMASASHQGRGKKMQLENRNAGFRSRSTR